MKKVWSAVVVVIVLAAMVALMAVCGNSQAKLYVQQANEIMTRVDSLGTALSGKISHAFSSVTSPAAFQTAVQNVKTATAELTDTANKAKAEYEKAKSESGAGDYGKYADLQLKVIALEIQLSDQINKFLDQALAIVNDPAGSTAQLTAAQDAFMKEADQLNKELTAANDAATKFKTQKNL